MKRDAPPDEVFEIEPAGSGTLAHLPWWLILSVAVVVTELTAHPSIGVTVLCLKFGWNDFRTALWLRRRDPYRRRGAICSWFYLSSGLWRVCVWSFGMMFLIVMFAVVPRAPQAVPRGAANNPAQPPAEFLTCIIVWLLSSAMATFFTLVSVWLARRGDLKVWVSGSISDSRRLDLWPPRPRNLRRPESNLLRWWLILTAIAVFVPAVIVAAVFFGAVVGPNPGRPGNRAAWAALALMAVLLMGAVFIVIVGSRRYERLGAATPCHCWPDHEVLADTDLSN